MLLDGFLDFLESSLRAIARAANLVVHRGNDDLKKRDLLLQKLSCL